MLHTACSRTTLSLHRPQSIGLPQSQQVYQSATSQMVPVSPALQPECQTLKREGEHHRRRPISHLKLDLTRSQPLRLHWATTATYNYKSTQWCRLQGGGITATRLSLLLLLNYQLLYLLLPELASAKALGLSNSLGLFQRHCRNLHKV